MQDIEDTSCILPKKRWYYHDSSVFYVMLTLRLGLLGFVLCLFAFELLLQGWIFGDLGQARATQMLLNPWNMRPWQCPDSSSHLPKLQS